MIRIVAALVAALAAILLYVSIAQFPAQAPLVKPTGGVVAGGPQDAVPSGPEARASLTERANLQRWREADAPSDVARPQGTVLQAQGGAGDGESEVRSWLSRFDEDRRILRDDAYLVGTVNLPIESAAVLQQPQGRDWRATHNTTITYGGGWVIFGVTLLLAVFLLLRGRIRLKSPESGRAVTRFNALERGVHWVTATSFVIMALTGLVILYGRHLLQPILGAAGFRDLAGGSAYLHIAFAVPFVLGAAMMFVLWIRENIWTRTDTRWLLRGGGFLRGTGADPSADRFNAGQKLVFWLVILGAILLLISGLALVFPLFWLGVVGTQTAQLVHAVVALLMIGVILGHIYIGTVGMQGAFDAMWSGKVDREWAREHHDLWARRVLGAEAESDRAPAE